MPIARHALSLLGAVATLAAGVVAAHAPRADATQPAPSTSLIVGVLRNDALLLPFAAYNGRRWSTPWPVVVPPQKLELPASLAAIPREWWGGDAPGPWQVWLEDREKPEPLMISGLAAVQLGFFRHPALQTTRTPVKPLPDASLPTPKMGIATAGNVELTPIASVSPLSPIFGAFVNDLRGEFHLAEERTIDTLRNRDDWRHPFPREVRVKVPVRLEAWYVTPVNAEGARLSYIEAVKTYPLMPDDQGCGLETFISGWVHHDERRTRIEADLKAVSTYCDRRGVSYIFPFGQVRVDGKVHWIAQLSGRAEEWYVVVEATADRVRYVAQRQAGARPDR